MIGVRKNENIRDFKLNRLEGRLWPFSSQETTAKRFGNFITSITPSSLQGVYQGVERRRYGYTSDDLYFLDEAIPYALNLYPLKSNDKELDESIAKLWTYIKDGIHQLQLTSYNSSNNSDKTIMGEYLQSWVIKISGYIQNPETKSLVTTSLTSFYDANYKLNGNSNPTSHQKDYVQSKNDEIEGKQDSHRQNENPTSTVSQEIQIPTSTVSQEIQIPTFPSNGELNAKPSSIGQNISSEPADLQGNSKGLINNQLTISSQNNKVEKSNDSLSAEDSLLAVALIKKLKNDPMQLANDIMMEGVRRQIWTAKKIKKLVNLLVKADEKLDKRKIRLEELEEAIVPLSQQYLAAVANVARGKKHKLCS